jgi:hypothetical protein
MAGNKHINNSYTNFNTFAVLVKIYYKFRYHIFNNAGNTLVGLDLDFLSLGMIENSNLALAS